MIGLFSSYNLTNFGDELRRIRQKNGLSQADVNHSTGINEDTLRRIENGSVIPKYETLEILSTVYRCDLLFTLQEFRRSKHFYDYYSSVDRIIANNEIHLLDDLIFDFKEKLKNNEHLDYLINPAEIRQFELFLEGINRYNTNSSSNHNKAEHTLISALKLTNSKFNIDVFHQFKYNLLDIRILFLLGLVKERNKEIQVSIDILSFVLYYFSDNNRNSADVQNIVLKSYSNLSYNYHRLDNHNLALQYACEGINYAIKHSNMNCLYLLYARKGVAEYLLGNNNFLDSLSKSIQILEINNQYKLAELYKKIILEKYKIVL